MHKNYLISIIIVTYNAEKHLGALMESLQTRINDQTEVIVIDGLSTDSTMVILHEYYKCISKVISEKDSGIYDAMNKGISMASGKYVLFLGADDRLLINLEELSMFLKDDKTIYYGDVLLSPSNKIYGGKFNTAKLINRNICHQSILFPKAVFEKYQYGKDFRLMEDYALNLKLWASKEFKFSYLEKTISVYSLMGLSSLNIDLDFKKDSLKLIFRYFGPIGVVIKLFNPIRNFFKTSKNSLS
ncbi:glycosyltransferase [Flavobacterium pokkalii]|nr:glycosyltransferase [Flavobacterium pokkalii]